MTKQERNNNRSNVSKNNNSRINIIALIVVLLNIREQSARKRQNVSSAVVLDIFQNNAQV